MINFFPNFFGCKYKMFTSMRECFSFQVCLQAYFFPLSLSFFASHSVILSPHYPPHQKQHGRFLRSPYLKDSAN